MVIFCYLEIISGYISLSDWIFISVTNYKQIFLILDLESLYEVLLPVDKTLVFLIRCGYIGIKKKKSDRIIKFQYIHHQKRYRFLNLFRNMSLGRIAQISYNIFDISAFTEVYN